MEIAGICYRLQAIWFIGLLTACHASDDYQASAKKLASCLNRNQAKVKFNNWEHAMSDKMAALPVARAWWSRRPSKIPLTLITQLSMDRLGQLQAQCTSWPGPISAALYVPLNYAPHQGSEKEQGSKGPKSPDDVLKAAVMRAQKFHAMAEQTLSCQLDLILAYERFNESRAVMLYPMNILRNYARLQARTPLIGLFDVDMLPSLSLYEDLIDPETARRYIQLAAGTRETPPSLLVVPAFITFDAQTATGNFSAEKISDHLVVAAKAQLMSMWTTGVINRFDPDDNGHRATQYSRWFNASEQYEVQYEFRYEPWVICDRLRVPWYDSRFRGYGQNKIVHLENMNWTGYKFVVHPQAWLIHRKHALGEAKLQHLRDFQEIVKRAEHNMVYETIYGHSTTLGRQIRADLAMGTYSTVLDPPTAACAERLSWWQQDHWQWQRQRGQRHAKAAR